MAILSSGELSSHSELCLFLASRAQHIKEKIIPALNEKKIVLCDRFNDSTVAYQGYARGLGMDAVQKFCDFVCEGLSIDLTFYLDLDPSIGLKRIKSGQAYDRIESEHISFHQKIREGFLLLAKKYPERFVVIDAGASFEKVFETAIKHMDYKLRPYYV